MCVAEGLTLHPAPPRIGLGSSSFQLQFVESNRQHLGPDSVLHPALVLLKAHVPSVMHPVLDCRPVIADQLGYFLIAHGLQRDTAHRVSHIGLADLEGRMTDSPGDLHATPKNVDFLRQPEATCVRLLTSDLYTPTCILPLVYSTCILLVENRVFRCPSLSK